MTNIAQVLNGVRGVSFIGLDQETPVTLTGGRKNPMQGRVTKRVTGSTVLVAQNKNTNTYQNMVRNSIVGEILSDATAKANEAKDLLTDVLSEEEIEALEAKIEASLAAQADDRTAEAEERFAVKPRKWGQRIPETPFIEHTKDGVTKFYLDTIFLRAGTTQYLLDGVEIDEDDIEGLKKTPVVEGAQVQGGLRAENQVVVRSIAVENILAIRTKGVQHNGPFTYA